MSKHHVVGQYIKPEMLLNANINCWNIYYEILLKYKQFILMMIVNSILLLCIRFT